MKYAVNLYFNNQAEAKVRDIWNELAVLDCGKCMSCYNGRPHITLAIYDDLDQVRAGEKLSKLAQEVHAFHLKFLQIGIFPYNKGAIFLTPNLTDELFLLHRKLHVLFRDWEEQSWEYYKPEAWHPHCTLSLETPIEEIPKVVEEILKVFHPIELTIESIGIVSLEPMEYLNEFSLAGPVSNHTADQGN